jgi:hypothetical protein
LHIPKTDTKLWSNSIDLVNGLFTGAAFSNFPEFKEHKRPYGIAEIKLSIDRFAQAAFDHTVMPFDKKLLTGLSPCEFILNKHCKSTSAKYAQMSRSNFLHYLHNAPVLQIVPAQPNPDKYPEMTKALMDRYRDLIQGGLKTHFDVKNQNKFILAAEKLTAFVDAFRHRFSGHYQMTNFNLAETLIKCLIEDQEGVTQKITPGYLCSDQTFNQRFPNYLFQMAILNMDVQGQPWRYAVHHFGTPREEWLDMTQSQY